MTENIDDFIGQRFGKDGCMEVVGWDGSMSNSPGSNKMYTIKCSVCAIDSELFGEGHFKSRKSSMLKGQIPCGCSVGPKWTTQQYKVLADRYCKDKGYKLVGFSDEIIQARSRVSLTCAYGHSWDISVNALMNGTGCLECSKRIRGLKRRRPDNELIDEFMASGKFPQGTTFKRLSTINASSRAHSWEVTCPKCSNDEYVESGNCTGIFYSLAENLKKGKLTCRCSPTYKWTQSQREYQINKVVSESFGQYKFLGWADKGYYGAFSKFNIECDKHGSWEAGVDKFVNSGQRCPSCAKGGYSTQKEGYVYVLKVGGVTCDFTGYGISNHLDRRLGVHNMKLSSYGFKIMEQVSFKTTGQKAFDIELNIKHTFPCYPQEVEGFVKEATYPHLYQDVVKFVEAAVNIC